MVLLAVVAFAVAFVVVATAAQGAGGRGEGRGGARVASALVISGACVAAPRRVPQSVSSAPLLPPPREDRGGAPCVCLL